MAQDDHIDAVVIAGRERLIAGDEADDMIAFFRDEGLTIFAAIRATQLVFDIDLREARELVETGPAFNNEYQVHAARHLDLLRRLQPIVEAAGARYTTTAGTGATQPGSEPTA